MREGHLPQMCGTHGFGLCVGPSETEGSRGVGFDTSYMHVDVIRFRNVIVGIDFLDMNVMRVHSVSVDSII